MFIKRLFKNGIPYSLRLRLNCDDNFWSSRAFESSHECLFALQEARPGNIIDTHLHYNIWWIISQYLEVSHRGGITCILCRFSLAV